jgi:CRP-like cAMP-binding protein
VSRQHLKPLVQKLETVLTLTNDEAAALDGLPVRIGDFRKTETLISEGDRPTQSFTVLSGLTCMYKNSAEGRRQILIFHFPGDFPDLQSLHLNVLDMSIAAMARTKVAFVQHQDVRFLYARYPRLGEALWRMSLVDAAILRERMLNLGQRQAYARTAHFMCEYVIRMKLAGLFEDGVASFPLTQQEIGDALGLSNIHVNRMTQRLKEEKLLELARSRLKVLNWERLRKVAEFDPTYLHLTPSQKRLLAS